MYYLQGDSRALYRALDDLADVIDEGQDDVRAYLVRPLSEALQLGCPWLPEGIGLVTGADAPASQGKFFSK